MPSKSLPVLTALALVFVGSNRTRADDPAPPVPTPAPAPTEKPAERPDEKPAADGFTGFNPAPAAALSPKQRKRWNVKAESGAVAVLVLKDGPAGLAGLRDGDVLLKYAGVDVPATKDLDVTDERKVKAWQISFGAITRTVKEAAVVEIVVEREGKPVTLTATAICREALQVLQARQSLTQAEENDDEDDADDGEEGEGPEKAEKGEKGEKPVEPKKDAPK